MHRGQVLPRHLIVGLRPGGLTTPGPPATAQLAALLLGGPAPYTALLIGDQGKFEAFGANSAPVAHRLGRFDLFGRRCRGTAREEEIQISLAAQRGEAPVVGIPITSQVSYK